MTALAVATAGAAAGPALAGDAAVRRAAERLPLVEATAARGETGAPEHVQRAYDAARDMEEALRRAAPASRACAPLLRAARAYARGRVLQAEGVDRLSPAAAAAGRRRALGARPRVARARGACRGDGHGTGRAVARLLPAPGEATFGGVIARGPRSADAAELRLDGGPARRVAAVSGVVRTTVVAAPGRHDLAVRFLAGDRVVAAARSRGIWVLPPRARAAAPGRAPGGAASARLRRAAALPGATTAAWTQDLATGRTAGWNAGARFPAASTVKLGVLVAALARAGAAPERSPLAHDLRAMATWSSNLGTNRALARLGRGSERAGAALATRALARMGARSSTFPGGYIVGTELQPALGRAPAAAQPTAVSARVTTAQDLARVLYALHAAAAGRRAALRATGLSPRAARLALGWLLSSERRGENRSLVAGGLPRATPVAQKNGWIRSARHGAAIAYEPGGARILVLLTYRAGGVPLGAAAAAGARVAATL